MEKKLKYIFTISVVASPALAVYDFLPGTNLAMAIIFVIGFLFLLLDSRNKLMQKDESQLFITIFFLTIISTAYMLIKGTVWFNMTLMFHNFWSIILCFFPLIFVVKKCSVGVFVRTAYLIGSIAAMVVVWQRISFIITGSFNNEIFLPWFEMKRGVDDLSIDRPSAFFSEPAHFAIFMLPISYLSLLDKRYILSALYFFSIMCCGSSTGFIVQAIVFLYFSFGIKGKYRIARIIVILAAIIVGYGAILVYYPQIIQENIDKILLMQEGNDESATIRLFGPLEYLRFMDNVQLMIGITLNQLANLLTYNHQYVIGSKVNLNYANGWIFMFISYGAIGFFMLLHYLRKKWGSSSEINGFVLIFIMILSTDQILFNAHFLYLASYVMLANCIMIYIKNTNNGL